MQGRVRYSGEITVNGAQRAQRKIEAEGITHESQGIMCTIVDGDGEAGMHKGTEGKDDTHVS